ncbi:MAG: hypothetical protein GTO63_10400 [Anaerolineae bacterium]|nr:hypothetical protein [Anaerolineae bacterium]NIN95312.1 hypothetical protein [Anaerolineae bacterium]NIQ78277.1 hypothetical protein [Anaerolineae bacterium]
MVWVFVVYLGYYTVHKPFTAPVLMATLDRLADLTLWAGVVLLATGLGHRVLRGLAYDSLLEELSLSAGLGLGLISFLTLGLGLAGLLSRWLFFGLALVGYVALFGEIKTILRRLRTCGTPPLTSLSDRLLAAYLVVVSCLTVLASLTPPIAWDSQVYHLTGPKLYIERGRIIGGIDLPYLGFPSLLQMLFLAGMLLKSDIVPKLMHLGYGLLTVGLLYCFARRFLHPKTQLLAPAIYLSAPTLVLISTWAYVDLGLAFYVLAAFHSLMVWTESRERTWLMLSGAFAGLSLGVKYTAVVTPLILVVIVIWESWSRRIAGVVRNPLLFCAATIFFACPWYLRNLAFWRNPFYPFLFGGPFWDEFRAWWFSRFGTGLSNEPVRLFLAPWEMTIMGVEGKAGYGANIGPVFLICLPLLMLVLIRRNSERLRACIVTYSLLICGANYLLWLYGVAQSGLLRQTRLLFPIFPLLAILASIAVQELGAWDAKGFSPRRLLMMVLVLALGLNAFSFILSFVADSPLPYIVGLETREQYLQRHLGDYYLAVSYINKELPPSARVLFLWEPRSYYCEKDCWPDAILDRFKHLSYEHGDAEGIAEYVRAQSVSHVLFHKAGFEHILAAQFDPILPSDVAVLDTLLDEYVDPLTAISDSYVVYRLR